MLCKLPDFYKRMLLYKPSPPELNSHHTLPHAVSLPPCSKLCGTYLFICHPSRHAICTLALHYQPCSKADSFFLELQALPCTPRLDHPTVCVIQQCFVLRAAQPELPWCLIMLSRATAGEKEERLARSRVCFRGHELSICCSRASYVQHIACSGARASPSKAC